MNKFVLIFLIFISILSNYKCAGITNYKKIQGTYIINIASEDINIFRQKLDNILFNIKDEYNTIIKKALINTVLPYIFFIVIIWRKITLKFIIISLSMIIISNLGYNYYIWKDYKYGIKSAKNAIYYYEFALNNSYKVDLTKSNIEERKYKIDYLDNEIRKYGIHAIFCEIPGTLPSNNANPVSYSSGSFCFIYDSQRKFLDPEAFNYVGDVESQKYRKIQINKTFDLF